MDSLLTKAHRYSRFKRKGMHVKERNKENMPHQMLFACLPTASNHIFTLTSKAAKFSGRAVPRTLAYRLGSYA